LTLGFALPSIPTPAVLQFNPKEMDVSVPWRGEEMVNVVFPTPFTTLQENKRLSFSFGLIVPLLPLTPPGTTTLLAWGLVPLHCKPTPIGREALVKVVFPIPLITSQVKSGAVLPFARAMKAPPENVIATTKRRAINGDTQFTCLTDFCISKSFLLPIAITNNFIYISGNAFS
jgi:hypothetical protein